MREQYGEERLIQEELTELLRRFHVFCREHGILYTLHGGTMLGAVRHGGFIPWDDDVDVAMMRQAYEQLREAFGGNRDGEMTLDTETDKIKRVRMHRPGKPAVWIDIFIYDYISEKPLPQKLKILGITLLTPFVKTKETMALSDARGRAKGIRKLVFKAIYLLGSLFPLPRRMALFDRYCRTRFPGSRRFILRSNDQYVGMKIVLPAEYMGEFRPIRFEGGEFLIAARYHELLVSSYGEDYMTPVRFEDCDRVHRAARAQGADQ